MNHDRLVKYLDKEISLKETPGHTFCIAPHDELECLKALRALLEASKPVGSVTVQQLARQMVALWLYSCRYNPGDTDEAVGRQRAAFIAAAEKEIADFSMANKPVELAGWRRVPVEPTEEMIIRHMNELHANVPEADRPMGLSDFSDDQMKRIKAGYAAMLAAAPQADQPQQPAPGRK